MIFISKNKNKIPLDKYYTTPELAEYVVSKTKEIIGEENITEYIEPSAGGGVFLDYLDKPYLAYDIEPEDDRIIKQDYLELDIGYKKGRCVIGNPPFGNRMNLARQFYNKSIEMADYIAFILPISQLNNRNSLYEFDLIHSENLGVQKYTNRDIHCCFNIYKRPKNNEFNNKPDNKLKDLDIYRDDYRGLVNGKTYSNMEYNLCIFRRGVSVGKIKIDNINKQTYKIVIHNKKLKSKIINEILNFDWKNYKIHQSAPSISKNDIYMMLKENIPEIK